MLNVVVPESLIRVLNSQDNVITNKNPKKILDVVNDGMLGVALKWMPLRVEGENLITEVDEQELKWKQCIILTMGLEESQIKRVIKPRTSRRWN